MQFACGCNGVEKTSRRGLHTNEHTALLLAANGVRCAQRLAAWPEPHIWDLLLVFGTEHWQYMVAELTVQILTQLVSRISARLTSPFWAAR